MPTNDAKKKYDIQYAKDKLKRIPLDVKKEKYEEIKTAADAVGESVNGYIKKAIDERMERENSVDNAVSAVEQPNTNHATGLPAGAPPMPKQEKHYLPFTESDAAKVNLQELQTNIRYQIDIMDTFGDKVLSSLMEKARQQAAEQPAESKE